MVVNSKEFSYVPILFTCSCMCTNNVHAPAFSLSVIITLMTVRGVGCNFAPTATGTLEAQGHRVTDATTISCSPAGILCLIHKHMLIPQITHP